MPKNWKYIKKLLEKEFLCEKLRGHITYDLTDYEPAPWYQQHFIMKYDDEVLLEVKQPRMTMDKRYDHTNRASDYHDFLINEVCKKYGLENCYVGEKHIYHVIDYAIKKAEKNRYHFDGLYGVEDIVDEIGIYLHSNINGCFSWGQDPFVKALGVLDRRCGKRRLNKMVAYYWVGLPKWLKRIYEIRFDVEGIKYTKYDEKMTRIY